MPGLKFTTNLDAEALYKLAFRRAQDAGYSVRDLGNNAFSATQGSMALSVLAVSSYCDFRVSIEKYGDGNELVLERNSPWMLGKIGVARVKSKAATLFDSFKQQTMAQGGQITRELEF